MVPECEKRGACYSANGERRRCSSKTLLGKHVDVAFGVLVLLYVIATRS